MDLPRRVALPEMTGQSWQPSAPVDAARPPESLHGRSKPTVNGQSSKGVAHLLDGSAVGLSALCLVHCLLLPVAASLLPLLGAWSEAEWTHQLFVAIAAPLSWFALLRTPAPGFTKTILVMTAGIGLLLLVVGAFAAHGEAETLATVAGSLCLAAAHLINWRVRRRGHALG